MSGRGPHDPSLSNLTRDREIYKLEETATLLQPLQTQPLPTISARNVATHFSRRFLNWHAHRSRPGHRHLHLASTTTSLNTAGMKVKITGYKGVAEWKWDLPPGCDDTCGICRVVFESTCSKCMYPGDECPIGKYPVCAFIVVVDIADSVAVVGQCKHVFHLHCITDWIQSEASQGRCPMCRQVFKEKKADTRKPGSGSGRGSGGTTTANGSSGSSSTTTASGSATARAVTSR